MELFISNADGGVNSTRTKTREDRSCSDKRCVVCGDPLIYTIIITVTGWTVVLAAVLL